MKKILFIICMLAWGNIYAQLFSQQIFEEKKTSSFSVELGGLVVIVPSAPIEKQCQFVAYRSVNPIYQDEFDKNFFSEALDSLIFHDDSNVFMLKNWGNIFSPDGNLVIKEKFVRFLRTAKEDYNISIKMLSSNNSLEVWQIGKVKLFVHKESTKKRKNKIGPIPDGYYYITTKQPLN